MATTFTATEARAKLPAIIDMVIDGHEITITRHGRPVAVIVNPGGLRYRRMTPALRLAEELGERMQAAREGRLPPGPGLTTERAEELVAAIRADRDSE
jgi:prevent-host-death family protein